MDKPRQGPPPPNSAIKPDIDKITLFNACERIVKITIREETYIAILRKQDSNKLVESIIFIQFKMVNELTSFYSQDNRFRVRFHLCPSPDQN